MAYNEWLDIEVLEDYLDGKLDAKMMHKVERISLEDPFVAEALAGLSQSPKRSQSLSLLQKQLRERVAQKPEEKKRWTITSQRLSIAATAAILFVTVSLLFYMRESNRRSALAKQNKKIDVAISPQVAATQAAPPKVNTTIVEAEIDKALTEGKKSSLAKNKEKNRIIVDRLPKLAITPTADKQAISNATNNSIIGTKEAEEAKLEILAKNTAKKSNTNIQALSGRTAGVTFIPNTFTGRVVSKYNGLPISGADVKLVNTDIGTKTNAKGEFSIRKDSIDNYNLAINSVGFATKEMKISSNQFSIALEPAQNSLSEVAILGYGTQKKEGIFEVSTPLGGWDLYEAYLKNNNRLTQNGLVGKEVELSFNINKEGVPVDIKVVNKDQQLTESYTTEAIRLLKEGPKWTYKIAANNKGSLKVKF